MKTNPWPGIAFGVVDDVVEPDVAIQLAGGADGLEDDVVQPAIDVAAGRISLSRMTVPTDSLLERLHGLQEPSGRREIADVLEYVGLRADQLIGLGQYCDATVPDHLARDGSGQRVRTDTRERVRSATLQSDPEISQRNLFTFLRRNDRHPRLNQRGRFREVLLEAASPSEEGVRHADRRIPLLDHEVPDRLPRHEFTLGVDDQHRTDVRIQRKPGQRRQQNPQVVRSPLLAALGMRHRHDAIKTIRICRIVWRVR